ncbi:MAG: ComEC/Rec2 family competence protein [Verrucomicrobiaceae bacterium]
MERVRREAPMFAMGCGALAGALGNGHLIWAGIFLFLGLVLGRAGVGWKVAVVTVGCLVFWRAVALDPGELSEHRTTRSVSGELVLGRITRVGSGEREGVLRSGDGEVIRVAVQEAEVYLPGDVLEVEGRMFTPARVRNPEEFSMARSWRERGLEAGLDLRSVKVVGFDWRQALWRWAEERRAWLSGAVTRGIEDDGAACSIIKAMILGETPESTSEITRAFRFSGAMHVFAVSGLHVTIVGGLMWLGVSLVGVPRRPAILLIMLAMAGYAMVTGGRPPAMRATLMAVTFLSAFLLRRRPSLFNSLALSVVLVLVWQPSLATTIGFQLSYAVIGAIGLGFYAAYQLTGKMAEVDIFMPRRLLAPWQRRSLNLRGKVAGIMATSLAAWVGSLPWMAYHFGLVTPIAVMASVLLIPLTFCVLALGMLSALVGAVIPAVGGWVNEVNAVVAKTAFVGASGFLKVPGGHFVMDGRQDADWVVFDLSDGGMASSLDTGEGVLFDLGNERKFYQIVRPALRRWNMSPETAVLSHPEGKHTGALPALMEQYDPARVFVPVLWARSPSYRDFVESAPEGVVTVGKRGQRYELSDDAWFEVLREGAEGVDTVADSRGMAVKVHWDGWKVLVTGDLGIVEEREMMGSGVDLSADVVVMGRHSKTYSGSYEFLKATGAKVVVVSSSHFPKKELTSERWLKVRENLGIEFYVQSDTGAVLMDFDGERLCVKAFLQPERLTILER